MYRKAVFTIEDYPKAYMGYTAPIKWKCWDMAHFELAEAKRVAEGFNECAEHPMTYDPIYDQFFVWDEGNEDYDIIRGEDIETEEGIKHLYGIGAGNWLWDGITERKCFNLAQEIEDFIYEYDTYEAKDQYSDRYAMVEKIKTKLKDLTTFQQVYEVWNDEDLKAEQKFETLRKELKL